MTSTDLARAGLLTTPDGTAPCAVCGIPATGPTVKYPVLSRLIEVRTGERSQAMADGASVDLPTCVDCQAISDTARAIVAEHPGITRLLGTVATWQITTSLYALRALGLPLPGPDIEPARLGSLIRRLATPGAMTMYVRKLSPVWLADATPTHAALEPWSAVSSNALGDCRAAVLDWKADGRPVRSLPHPQRRQCEWCGTATAIGRFTSEAWFGDLCVTCDGVKSTGGFSYDALWQAIDPDRAIRGRRAVPPDLDGVRPYSRGQGGDGAPWSHLGGIDALHEHVIRLVEAS